MNTFHTNIIELPKEEINPGQEYKDYIIDDLAKENCSLEEGLWSIKLSKEKYYIPKASRIL
jgi:hypothetical protein